MYYWSKSDAVRDGRDLTCHFCERTDGLVILLMEPILGSGGRYKELELCPIHLERAIREGLKAWLKP